MLSEELEGAAERQGANHDETIESASSLKQLLISAGAWLATSRTAAIIIGTHYGHGQWPS